MAYRMQLTKTRALLPSVASVVGGSLAERTASCLTNMMSAVSPLWTTRNSERSPAKVDKPRTTRVRRMSSPARRRARPAAKGARVPTRARAAHNAAAARRVDHRVDHKAARGVTEAVPIANTDHLERCA